MAPTGNARGDAPRHAPDIRSHGVPQAAPVALAAARAEVLRAASPKEGLLAYGRARRVLERGVLPGEESRFYEDVSAAAPWPLVRAQAQNALARAFARQGHPERARALDDDNGLVREAWWIGPFENTGGGLFDQPGPAESPLSLKQRVAGVGREVGWHRLSLDDQRGAWLLGAQLVPAQEVRALVAFALHSDASGPAALRVGSSAPLVALWNGSEVLRSEATRALALDQDAALVDLRQGLNLVLLRVGNIEGPVDLMVRVTDPLGHPLPGVRPAVDEAALQEAFERRSGPFSRRPDARPDATWHPLGALREALASASPSVDERAGLLAEWVAIQDAIPFADHRRRPTEMQRVLEEWLALESSRCAPGALAVPAPHRACVTAAVAATRLGQHLLRHDPSAARAALEHALRLQSDADRLSPDVPAAMPALALHPAEPLIALAQLRARQGLVHEARALFRQAQAQAPEDPWVRLEQLRFERDHGQRRAEIDAALLSLAEAHPLPRILAVAADAALDAGDFERAATLYARLEESDQGHAPLLRFRADALEARAADPDLSEEERRDTFRRYVALLEGWLRMHPAAHASAGRLMRAWWGVGEEARALSVVQERQRAFPARPEPFALEAELSLLEGDRAAARDALLRALTVTPQDSALSERLRSLGDEQGAFGTAFALDLPALRVLPPAEGATEAGAELLASTLAVRFFANGLAEMTHERAFRVHDPQKALFLRSVSVPYAAGRERVEVLIAERWSSRGRREAARGVHEQRQGGKQGGMYTDAGAKVIVFGELQAGDVVHIKTRKELVGQQNLFGDFFGFLEVAQSAIPTRNWRVVVEGPKERTLYWGGRGIPAPRIEERDQHTRHDFQLPFAARIEVEDSMPPWLETAAFLSVSTYGSWEALGSWYAELIEEQLRLDDELRAVARRLATGLDNTRGDALQEKVRRAYEFVVEQTRYVGIELGIHGWKPYPVTEVFRRRYGDCKDKASLLVALLREMGVEARIALVRTANLGVIPADPPSMWAFNHAIAYVPALDLFLDGTAEHSGYRELPALDQGAMALVIAPPRSAEVARLVTIPVDEAEANYNESSYVLELHLDGSMTLEGEERFRGVHNAARRAELIDPATRRETLERSLTQILPGAAVHRVEVSDLALSASEVSYRFMATLPGRALRGSDGAFTLPLSLYPHGLTSGYARTSQRRHDTWVLYPWRTRNVMRYRLPPGARVVAPPASAEITSPHLIFRQQVTETPDGFIVDEDTLIRSRRIRIEEYEAFRRASLRADEWMKRKLRIEVPGGEG